MDHKTDKGNSIASVNQLHQEIIVLKHRTRGVSTRHLPDYLHWILFKKKLKYGYEARNRKSEAYMKMIGLKKSLINPDICKIPMPIDLYKAYGEYAYGLFEFGNVFHEGMYDSNGLLTTDFKCLYQLLS